MTIIHDRNHRGVSKTGWLDSQHTFSFGNFRDPNRMGVESLRVINEDRVIPGAGFATHGHQDMEILTYVLSGALAHKDSLGNGSIIRPGEIQRMSAGTGIRHSEMNASDTAPVHFLQIWIEPSERGIAPSYEQVELINSAGHGGFTLIAGPNGGEGAVSLHQDARIWLARPAEGTTVSLPSGANRAGFLQVVAGQVDINGEALRAGDGLELSDVRPLDITAETDAELIFFDLAKKSIVN
ncbi:MAG: pirin family protein [Pseudomonadota bacterium]